MAKKSEIAGGLKPNFERIDADGVSKFIGTVKCNNCGKPNVVTFTSPTVSIPSSVEVQVNCIHCGNAFQPKLDTNSLLVSTS